MKEKESKGSEGSVEGSSRSIRNRIKRSRSEGGRENSIRRECLRIDRSIRHKMKSRSEKAVGEVYKDISKGMDAGKGLEVLLGEAGRCWVTDL